MVRKSQRGDHRVREPRKPLGPVEYSDRTPVAERPPPRSTLQPLLTVKEVADLLRCSPRSVRRLAITFVKRGGARLYDEADVKRYIQRSKQYPISASDVRSKPVFFETPTMGFLEARELRRAEQAARKLAEKAAKKKERAAGQLMRRRKTASRKIG
jgi:excisionase family DNA binding protein